MKNVGKGITPFYFLEGRAFLARCCLRDEISSGFDNDRLRSVGGKGGCSKHVTCNDSIVDVGSFLLT